jgi:hypothetical protein
LYNKKKSDGNTKTAGPRNLIEFSDDELDENNNYALGKITKDQGQNNSTVSFPPLPGSLPVGDVGDREKEGSHRSSSPPPLYNSDTNKSLPSESKSDSHVRPCI